MQNTTLQEIKDILSSLKEAIIDQLSNRVVSAKQVKAMVLAEITENLGLIRSGEFRSGNDKEPGKGFSGVRIGYPPFRYNSQDWNVAGINADRLEFGLSAETGKALAAGGNIQIGVEGIVSRAGTMVVQSAGLSHFSMYGTAAVQISSVPSGSVVQYMTDILGIHTAQCSLTNPENIIEYFGSGSLDAYTLQGTTPPYIIKSPESLTSGNVLMIEGDGKITFSFANTTTQAGMFIRMTVRSLSNDNISYPHFEFTNTIGAHLSNYGEIDDTWSTVCIFIHGDGTGTPVEMEVSRYLGTNTIMVDNMTALRTSGESHIGSSTDYPPGTIFDHYPHTTTPGGFRIATNLVLDDIEGRDPAGGFTQTPDHCVVYMSNNKFVIKSFDDVASLWRYKYLDLNGTGVTWVNTAVAP